MPMSLSQTQQVIQAYVETLLHGGDVTRCMSDDVVAVVEGTAQRAQGRDAVSALLAHSYADGEIKLRNVFAGEGQATVEADLLRGDGVAVPHAVVYDLDEGRITALHLYFTAPIQP